MRTPIAIVLAALLAPTAVRANGYDVPNTNPRDLAMAGSAVAAQVDAGSAYQNPAALSKLTGINISLSATYLDNRTGWTAAPGSALTPPTADTLYKPAPPVGLFAAYGFAVADRPAGVGIGFNVPAGGNVFWDNAWAGRSHIITVNRKVYGTYLTAGVEIIPRLRLGGGLVYYYTTEYLKQGVGGDPSAFAELATKGGAVSYDVSAEWTPLADLPLTIGVDYKHKGTQTLKGDAHFNVPPALYTQDPTLVDQSVTHVLTIPNVLHTGLGYRAMKELLLTFDYTFNRYVVYQDDTFVGGAGKTIVVPRLYGNGYTFRLGGEYTATKELTVRAGVLRDISGLKTYTYSPTLPDGNAWVASAGGGWKFTPDFSLDLGLFYAWLDKVTVTDPPPDVVLSNPTLKGSYSTTVFIASLGVTWRSDLGGGKK
ncbi:MAG TPA: outer membrane protein transport protein [Anaeromyxobacteraceae bacterium]|nr:outer membrane protein transport protein [Anaeromyxobacteraceae bacterium]